MDAVKFAKTMRKICRTHTNCIECEFMKVQGHCGIMNPETDHAEMVAVAEQWEREHVEKDTEEESRNLLKLMVALTDKVDRLEEKIKAAESMIEGSRRVTDATFGEVDEPGHAGDRELDTEAGLQAENGNSEKNGRKEAERR